MDSKTQALFEARAKVMKAFAHPSRLFIVDRLSRRDHSVQELADMVGADISTVSRHLSVLKNAGLVQDRKGGQKVYYRLACDCALDFFSCVETVIETSARKQKAPPGETRNPGSAKKSSPAASLPSRERL